jgi:hypothetical protein
VSQPDGLGLQCEVLANYPSVNNFHEPYRKLSHFEGAETSVEGEKYKQTDARSWCWAGRQENAIVVVVV